MKIMEKRIEDMTHEEFVDYYNTSEPKDILIQILKELQK